MTNSVVPDQLASSEATDLDLYCLQRQGISRFSRTRVYNVVEGNGYTFTRDATISKLS